MTTRTASATSTVIFVAAIVIAGGAALASSIQEIFREPLPVGWLLLAALTLFSFVFTIRVPGLPARISVSETFVFTCVLLFGTAAATVTVALDALIMSAWKHRRDPLKLLFNATEPALSIWVASHLFFFMVGTPVIANSKETTDLLVPVLVLSLTYFLLNSSLTAIAVSLQTGNRVLSVWRTHFLWLALNYLGGASVAILIVQHSDTVGIATISIILPLLVITYLTFKSSMGRIDDANKHVAQLNQMYMSTIETLAMAVDAKDQTTHGHIRRVQTHAVGLARALGVNDASLISAIEAAALLHDIGKIGVPEHILNKPGRLSEAEFEQMKQHATMGADILSAIDFPYPVVPIVRHHHENWDGTGYPDRLVGSNIPIGARILSVVDCFDALTSDRPYRRKLSDQQALNILKDRRGSMYDPWIVDAFCDAYPEMMPIELPTDQEPVFVPASHLGSANSAGTLSQDSPPVVLHKSQSAQLVDVDLIRDVYSSYLRQLFPDSACVIYGLDQKKNELFPALVIGTGKASLRNVRMNVGSGVSGWVAANHQIAINSDPQPDFADVRSVFDFCVSAPIVRDKTTLGVITAYKLGEAFTTQDQKKLSEAVKIGRLFLSVGAPNSLSVEAVDEHAGRSRGAGPFVA
jgi:putative nucleotidyltransferase with HDIG domain